MSDPSHVFLLWHSHGPDPCDNDQNAKLLGVYSTRSRAEDRITRSASIPGFREYPDGFIIDEYEVDVDTWVEGFVEIGPDT